jgi:hypothetical protein
LGPRDDALIIYKHGPNLIQLSDEEEAGRRYRLMDTRAATTTRKNFKKEEILSSLFFVFRI